MRENYYDHDGEDLSPPEKIYVEITNRCNLHCRICFRNSWIDEALGFMDPALFYCMSKEVRGLPSVKEVFFGGMGEPLLHSELPAMIASVPGHCKVSLVTNGSLLTYEMSKLLIHAGLDELWISVDSFHHAGHESIQPDTAYNRLLESLNGFNHARNGTEVKLGIALVITADNIDELQHLDAFADRYHVDEINLSYEIQGKPLGENEVLYNVKSFPVGKMHRLAEGTSAGEEDVCPFINNNAVFIRWDGAVVPCMQLLHNSYTYLYEEKRRITSFEYGYVQKSGLISCWTRQDYARFRYRVKEYYFPFCRHCSGCSDRKENLTDCFLAEGPACGACVWASGKIHCP